MARSRIRMGRGVAIALAGMLIAIVLGVRLAAMLGSSNAVAAEPAPPRARNTAIPVSRITASTPAPTKTDDGPPVVKRILPIDGPMRIGDYVWDDRGVPNGPLIITVDLDAGVLSAFRDGYEIGAAAILYGADGVPTPLGVFPITQKDAHHVSNLYDAPMPYMMRLTNDGVSIHGSEVKSGWATHGCVGVPVPFAKLLFAQARLGDRVIITKGKRLQIGQHI